MLSGSARRPGPDHAAGQKPSSGFDDHVAALAQNSQIRLRGRMIPHVGVHRRRQHHRSGEGQIRGGQEIVGQAVGEFRQQIGSGRRDHQDLILLRHADMLDRAGQRIFGARRGKQVGDALCGR